MHKFKSKTWTLQLPLPRPWRSTNQVRRNLFHLLRGFIYVPSLSQCSQNKSIRFNGGGGPMSTRCVWSSASKRDFLWPLWQRRRRQRRNARFPASLLLMDVVAAGMSHDDAQLCWPLLRVHDLCEARCVQVHRTRDFFARLGSSSSYQLVIIAVVIRTRITHFEHRQFFRVGPTIHLGRGRAVSTGKIISLNSWTKQCKDIE